MTRATRKALVDVYGTLIKAGWGEPTDRARGAGRRRPSSSLRSRPSIDLKKVARAIKQLQRLGEL